MNCLVGLFTGSDTELQLEAAWCLTNIAAGVDNHAMLVLRQAGPYLVTYLGNGSPQLQVRMGLFSLAVINYKISVMKTKITILTVQFCH